MLNSFCRLGKKAHILLAAMLIAAICLAAPAASAAGLKPDDLTYEGGSIVLHKQAERIAEDAWKVNVQATIKDKPVQPPQLEVVFVLDTSNSMLGCTYEAFHNAGIWHNHDANCPFTEEECNVYLAYHSGMQNLYNFL